MLLNLRDVLASENLCVSFDYTMDLREEEFYGEHPFQQPIHVQGKLENKADVFYLRAQVVAPVDTHCARCGVPVQVQKELEIDLVIASSLSNEEGPTTSMWWKARPLIPMRAAPAPWRCTSCGLPPTAPRLLPLPSPTWPLTRTTPPR